MKVLLFAGSLRTNSVNKQLARESARLLATFSVPAEFIDLKDYPAPIYDGDDEQDGGVPNAMVRLGSRIAAAEARIIATPEYNGGISGVLKNAVDWISRLKPMPLAGKHLLLLGASPGGWGGIRGLWHSRVPFEALGVHVFPQMMSVAAAASAFDEAGHLQGERLQQLQNLLAGFTAHFPRSAALKAA